VSEDFGGYWTRAKLLILAKYLHAFNQATQRAGPTIYLDLFAGDLNNKSPQTSERYEGSTGVALRCEPAFGYLLFWALDNQQANHLRVELANAFPNDDRYQVITGDCNTTVTEGLQLIEQYRKAPTFAFIDPKGLDVAWTTLEALSRWRKDRLNRKVEMWILLPDPAISRVLGLRGNRGRGIESKLNKMFGSSGWKSIYALRDSGELSGSEALAEYVNLYRWRIEHVLGYSWTHAIRLDNISGSPVYTMIYATDDKTGNKIMRDIYSTAHVRDIPELKSRSLSILGALSDEVLGVKRLFELEPPKVKSSRYEYTSTWLPPARLDLEPSFVEDEAEDALFDI
jgi:three-Cys-motif partner protein